MTNEKPIISPFQRVRMHAGTWRRSVFGGTLVVTASALIAGEFSDLLEIVSQTDDYTEIEYCAVGILFLTLYALVRARRARTSANGVNRDENEHFAHLSHFSEFGKISAGLFHDLVSPLSAAALAIEQLQSASGEMDRERAARAISLAVHATKRMRRLMDMLKRHLDREQMICEFSARAELEEALVFLRYLAREHRVECRITGDAVIFGDPIKFAHVMTNLVSNAIESYGGEDPIMHAVDILIRSDASTTLIEVTDRGEGMTEDVREKMFDAFFTTKSNGIGLGLAATRDIVEKDFHGTLSCRSAPQIGTTVILTVPRGRASALGITKP